MVRIYPNRAGLTPTEVGGETGWFPNGKIVRSREFTSRGGRGNRPLPLLINSLAPFFKVE